MTKLRAFIVLVAALMLLSCSSNPRQEEVEVRRGKDSRDEESLASVSLNKNKAARTALEVPPDLLASSSEKVRLGDDATTDTDVATDTDTDIDTVTDTAEDEPRVLPVVIGATIQSDEDKSWLEIEADAEVVWQKLTEFWGFREVTLVEHHSEAGVMETEWFVKTGDGFSTQGSGSFETQLFDALTAQRTAFDKFTLRLERNSPDGTRVFVTHRGKEKISREYNNNLKTTDFEWVEREQDSEKISQLLQIIVLLFDSSASVTI